MEAEEAGVALWPQLPMTSSTFTQPYPDSESDSGKEANTSQLPIENGDRKRLRAEKRRRKEERAAKRAAKLARKEAREKRASLGGKGGDVLVPHSSAVTGLSSSFPEVSSSPQKEQVNDESSQSFNIKGDSDTQPSAPTVASVQEPSRSWPELSISPEKSVRSPDGDVNDKSTVDDLNSCSSQQQATSQAWPELSISPSKSPSPPPTQPVVKEKKRKEQHIGTPSSDPIVSTSAPSQISTLNPTPIIEDSFPQKADVQTAPKSISKTRPNAEAGPSTQGEKKKKGRPATSDSSTPAPKAKRAKVSRPREGEMKGRTVEAEDDEALRKRLANPSAAVEFIASQFWKPPYLNRLEEAGIITLRKGKVSTQEMDAVRHHLEIFMRSNRLDQEQLVEVIMAKSKSANNARQYYPSFWQDVAIQMPGRPLRYVVKQVQRMYDPRARQGAWTAKEDAELKRAYEFHPGMWTKIAAIVDRTEQDCRDRWNKEIVNSEKRNTGPWSLHEEDLLRTAVMEANRAIGVDGLSGEAPWEVVSGKLGHQRGPTQCRVKWHRELYPRENGTPMSSSQTPREKPIVPMSLAEKRATQSEKGAKKVRAKGSPSKPVVILKKGRVSNSNVQYKSEELIADSGSESEEKENE